MPGGMNVEIAHKLSEKDEQGRKRRGREELIEIVEAIVLAVVAIATAWSGYQAAKWDGRQAFLYGEASKYRIEADAAATLGGQERLQDISTFNTWIQATTSGDEELAALYERRFSPEYKVAFDEGTAARQTAEKYVRGTVLLATVLFLIALSQRFKLRKVRIGLLVVSGVLILYSLASLATYPRM